MSADFARRYVQRLVHDGVIDVEMSRFQLQAIEEAARGGRPILVVEDLNSEERQDHLTHAA